MRDHAIYVDWYLVRHAPVRDTRDGIYRSLDGDADLTDEQAFGRLAHGLPADARWWVSPLRRTRQTAERLRDVRSSAAPLVVDDRLREQSFGAWHGLRFADLWEKIRGRPPHHWSYLAPSTAPPEGESYLDLWQRVEQFVASLVRDADPRPRVVVTHAGVIRAIVGQAFGLDPSRSLALTVEPLSVTRLTRRIELAPGRADAGPGAPPTDERGGDWQLRYLNRTA